MPADNPQPGDRFIKSGVEFTVKYVENGQVYGVHYRAGADDTVLADDGYPESFINACRIDLDKFQREVEGAEYVKAW